MGERRAEKQGSGDPGASADRQVTAGEKYS